MTTDTITKLRDAQRALDRAPAARSRVTKRLTEIDKTVRQARLLAETIGREVQTQLNLHMPPTVPLEAAPTPDNPRLP